MRLHFINVGQGDATLLEFPCAAALIDTGGEINEQFSSNDSPRDYLANFRKSRPDLKDLSLILLTHPHVDHTSGVATVLDAYSVDNVVTNSQENGSGKEGQLLLQEYAKSRTGRVGFYRVETTDISEQGLTNNVVDPINCDGIDPKITVLWGQIPEQPEDWSKTDYKNLNNHSIVVRIDFGQTSMLFSGDLEKRGIQDLTAKYENNNLLDVDLYKVGHHGSNNATTQPLLDLMTPKMVVILMGPSTRRLNRDFENTAWGYGHPRESVIKMLEGSVTATRSPSPAATVQVATGTRAFTEMNINKAIYATGWDGNIVVEAGTHGDLSVVSISAPSLSSAPTAAASSLPTSLTTGDLQVIKNARIRSEPSVNSDRLTTLPAGTIVKSIGKEGRWIQIQYGENQTGWVYSTLVKKIN